MRLTIPVLLSFALLALTGCTGMRFVVEAVAGTDELVETTVLVDDEDRLLRRTPKVAMIDVNGMIMDARRPGLLNSGENPLARFSEALTKARHDKQVRAVVLRINSPGGTVTASDIAYREVMDFRERSGKPVVVLMGGVAASGGYYLACAGDEVIAHPTTVTGSIGVIMQTFNFSEGMRKIGIRSDAITSGPNKKMGSPFEPMPAEHRTLLQGLVNEFYDSFVEVVTASRATLSPADMEWITDGRVVTGAKAAEVGLVDRTGDLRDAFDAAKERAGIMTGRLVKYHRPMEYVGSPYAGAPAPPAQSSTVQLNFDFASQYESIGFYYVWDPTVW
jgi:protease-4